MKFREFLWLCIVLASLAWLVECLHLEAPIKNVRRGHKDRVEYIAAEIKKKHLDKGSGTSAKTMAYARTMGNNNDDAGHLIARRLGGTGRETYNIVPQHPGVNRGAWRGVEGWVYKDVSTGKTVIFRIWPKYRGKSTRPFKLEYQVKHPDGSFLFKKSSIANPTYKKAASKRTNSKRITTWASFDFF